MKLRYSEAQGDPYGDFDDQIDRAHWNGYKEGVDRAIAYIESTRSYRKLEGELAWAKEEGII